jgi:hypothetical protein
MKKTVFVNLLLLLVVNVIAQKKNNDATIGIRAGANFANIIKTNDKNFATQIKAGFNVGTFIDIPIVSILSLQPELQFSQKGYITNGSAFGNNYEYSVTTNFIEVPILAKLKPTKDFAVLVGPQYSFLTSTSTKLKSGNNAIINNVNEDNNNLRKNILGGVIGLEATSNNVIIGLRYSLDFQRNNGDGTSTTPSYKNQVLAVMVGFKF